MLKSNRFHLNILAAIVVLSIATAQFAGAQTPETRLFAITTSDSIQELDPTSGATLRSIAKPEDVSPGPDGLAYDGTSLYFISSFGSNTIYQLDPESGATLRTINPDVTCSIDALAHSGLFIYGLCYNTDEVYRIDPATGASLLAYPAASSILGGMTFAGTRGTLFVSSGNAVLEVDPETGLQVGTLNIGMQTLGLGFSNASGLLFAGTIDGMVLALDPTDGSLQYLFSVGSTPYALAADEALVHEGRALVAIPSSLDFGAVEVGTTASGTIRLVSAGTEPVTVSAIQVASGDAAVADAPGLPVQIAAGESVSFSVEVTAAATGPIEAVIRVESDDDTQPALMLPVSANALEVQPAAPGMLYGTTGGSDGGRLITIDAATGAGTLIGDLPGDRFPGVAIDSQGRLFAAEPDGTIHRLDGATGTSVQQISTGLGRMAALSFDINDVLHAIAFDQTFRLFTIDLATGNATPLAIVNQFINGMSFSPIDGTLWGATTDQIYTIDTITGAERLVGAAGLSRITDIQFDTDGNLYGTAGGGEEENQLVVIDQATGSASVVGPIGFSSVSGLAAHLLPQEGSHLALLPPNVNFGSVAVGETAERAVVLRSVGTSAVAITSISSPAAPFTTVAEPIALPLTLQPGEEELLTLAFSPSAAGTFESEITVSSTDADQPNKSVRLQGQAFQLTTADVGQCYGSTGGNDGGRLLLVNSVTGAASLIANVAAERLPGLAIDPDGHVFVANEGEILRVDAVTGEAVLLGGSRLLHLTAIAFDTDGVLYGVDDNTLYRIDRTSGRASAIGVTGAGNMRGLAVDPADGSLWASTPVDIWQLDKVTAAATFKGSFGLNAPVTDIAFDRSGNLFGTAGGSNQDNVLVSIDKTTREATVVGSLGFFSVSGLACDVRVLDGPHIGSLPLTVDFGSVETVGSFSRTISVRNVGTEPLSVNQVTAPDAPFGLSAVPALPAVLEPFEKLTFEVTFASSVDGLFSSSIDISSNDPDDAVKTVNLTANAVEVGLAEPGLLYASTGGGDGGRLMSIDAVTGAGMLIGDPPAERLPGLAIDSNGRIFAADPDGNLHLLDAGTGADVRAVQAGAFRMAAIAFDGDDVLYGIGHDPQTGRFELFTIDTATGTRSRTGFVDDVGINGMSFHPVDGSLWVTTARQIFTLDTATGQMTFVGDTGMDHITDIQFDLDGNLFATAGGGNEPDNRLAMIDQSTGEATVIGSIGFTSVSGLSARLGRLDGPHLAVSPPAVNFGQQEVGASRDLIILLRSVGTEEVTISAITAVDAPFVIVDVPTTPSVLQPGETDSLILRFSPVVAGPFETSITISSNDPDSPERILPVQGDAFVLGLAEVGLLYGSTGTIDGGRLILIDPATGVGSLIGNTSAERLPGLAIDSNGRIYAGDDEGWLHLVDAATGEIRRSVYTGLHRLPAIAFDASDELYAFANDQSFGPSLFLLDPATGSREIITRVQHEFRGMSFNPIDGSLWASTNTSVYSVNIAAGTASFLTEPWYTSDLQFDMEGNLFVLSGGGQGPVQLLLVDTVTGASSVVGQTGFVSVSGLAARLSVLEGPHIAVLPPGVDFGPVEVGESHSRPLILRNVGSEPVTVSSISAPGEPFGIEEMPGLPLVLEPGAQDTLKITLMAAAVGSLESELTITSDDLDQPERTVILRGEAFALSVAETGVFYGSTGGNDGGRLIRIDRLTGAGTLVGDPAADRLPSLAIDSRGRIYAGDPEGRIYLLDAATGAVKRTVVTGLLGMFALTFDRRDDLYAFGIDPNAGPSLFRIDPQTGTRTLVGTTEVEFRGASFHPLDGSLWASGAEPVAGSNTAIYEVNPTTGEAVMAGAISVSDVTDLQFDPLGTLYATVGGGRQEDNRLVRIDRDTWSTTVVGPIGFTSVSGLGMRMLVEEGAHLITLPAEIDFLQTRIGGSKTRTVGLLSVGTEAVTVNSIGTLESPFSVEGAPTSPVTLQPGELLEFEVAFAPAEAGAYSGSLVVSSTDDDQPEITISLSGSGAAFALDGDLSEDEYRTIGSTLVQSSFGPETNLARILYVLSDDVLYLGFQSRVQNSPNVDNAKPDGLGVLLSSTGETGAPAGTPLGIDTASDFHYLNGMQESGAGQLSFTADFEVDYMFAAYSDATPGKLILDAGTHVAAGKAMQIQRLGETDQSGTASYGPPVDGVFSSNSIEFAFQPSTGSGDRKGLEIAIPLRELGGGETAPALIETFAFIVSSTAYFSNDIVPGTAARSSSLGFEPDFAGNVLSVNCACPAPGQPLGNGPFHASIEVAIATEDMELPTEFALYQNYPNPFNPSTTVTFDVPAAGRVRLTLYDVLGRQVSTIFDRDLAPGSYSVEWDGRDATGRDVASGIYVYRMEAGKHMESRVMTLVK